MITRRASLIAEFGSQISNLRMKFRSSTRDHFISGKVISDGWAKVVGSALVVQFDAGD